MWAHNSILHDHRILNSIHIPSDTPLQKEKPRYVLKALDAYQTIWASEAGTMIQLPPLLDAALVGLVGLLFVFGVVNTTRMAQ